MLRDAVLVAVKDLRIEARSRVGTNQVLPFAVLVLVLFAFALDADRGLLVRAAAGLFWLAVTFSALLAVQRSFAIESNDAARDGLRLSGLDPAGIFLGKAGAVALQLLALQVVLGAGVVILYGAELRGMLLLAIICIASTVGLAAAGTLYGVLAAGSRVGTTLLPLLLLPVLAPVVLAATRASEAALGLGIPTAEAAGAATAGAWPWVRLLGAFSAVYLAVGAVAFGPLLEDG